MTFSKSLIEILDLPQSPSLEKKALTAKDQETLYATGFGLYEAGDYKNSADIFERLVLHDPYDTRFWKGLASSKQMQREYKSALHAWGVLSLLEGHAPTSHFHAAECYLSLDELEETKKALECARLHLDEAHPMSNKVQELMKRVEHG